MAQVWRSGRTQANLARALKGIEVVAPDDDAGHRCGELLAKTSTSDVVDGFLVVLARTGDLILTSDVSDIVALTTAAKVSVTVARV